MTTDDHSAPASGGFLSLTSAAAAALEFDRCATQIRDVMATTGDQIAQLKANMAELGVDVTPGQSIRTITITGDARRLDRATLGLEISLARPWHLDRDRDVLQELGAHPDVLDTLAELGAPG